VLEDLDNAADDCDFPIFDNPNCDYFGFRLEVYRSVDDYAIVFNTISFRDGIIRANIDPFGGCVDVVKPANPYEDLYRGQQADELAARMQDAPDVQSMFKIAMSMGTDFARKAADIGKKMAESPRAYETPRILETGEIDVDYPDDDTRVVRAITVRGRAVAPDSLTYSEPEEPDNGDIRAMVALVENPGWREALLATQAEVLQSFPRGMPPRFLTLNDWCHIRNERPSECETFQLLAKAIVTRDPSLYRPRAKPNTHWKRWYFDK